MPDPLPGLLVYSPMPPMRNGIADYTFELLLELRHRYRCHVVWPPGEACTAPEGVTGVDGLMPDEARRHFGLRADTPILYQVGNNPDHVFMLPAMARHPGLVVVHDPCLHHLLDCATLQRGDEMGYLEALRDEYGTAGAVLAEQFEHHRLREQQVFYRLPMLRHLLGPSRHVLAHSRYAAGRVRAQRPDIRAHVVPHAVSIPERHRAASRQAARQRLRLDPDHFIVLALGFVTRAKRLDLVLRALAAAAPRLPPFTFVVGGELRPEELDVEALARELGIAARVTALGYVSEDGFFDALRAADVLVNLRDPIGGETSGTLMRALGLGSCAIVPDRGPFSELPDAAVAKLDWRGDVIGRLGRLLEQLAAAPERRAAIGAAAARLAAEAFAPGVVAAGYDRAIRAMQADPPLPWASPVRQWVVPRERAAEAGQHTAGSALAAILAGPLGQACRTLAICGAAQAEELRRLAGPGLAQLAPSDAGTLREQLRALPPRGFDLVLLADAPALLGASPELLAACNRVLAVGGQLLASAPASREAGCLGTHAAGRALLAACGFELDETMVAAPPAGATEAAPQRWWRAFKRSDFVARPDRALVLAGA